MRQQRNRVVTWLLAVGIAACGSDTAPTDPNSAPPLITGMVFPSDGSVSTAPAAAVYGPGDTIKVQFGVDAQLTVAWVGLAADGIVTGRESIAVSMPSTHTTATAALVAPSGVAGVFRLTAFARDRVGTLGETLLAGNPVSLYATVTRPTVAAPTGSVRDFAFDSARGVVYLSVPRDSAIAVLSLATMQYGSPIAVGEAPAAIDLTTSGDSLVVALPGSRAVGIADLGVTPPAWSSVPLQIDTSYYPDWLRIMPPNTAFITLVSTHSQAYDAGRLFQYNLETGTQGPRTDVAAYADYSGFISGITPLARAADRSRLLFVLYVPGGPWSGDIYTAQTDTFLHLSPLQVPLGDVQGSVDAKGHRFLVGWMMLDTLLHVSELLDPLGKGIAGTLSPSGDTAYFGFGTGVLRTRLSDGATIEKVSVPEPPIRIAVEPGGRRLLVFSAQHVYRVDLNGPPTPTGSQVRAPLTVQLRGN